MNLEVLLLSLTPDLSLLTHESSMDDCCKDLDPVIGMAPILEIFMAWLIQVTASKTKISNEKNIGNILENDRETYYYHYKGA